MTKPFLANVQVVKATIQDYPIIQNLARFYVYDLSRFCGFISDEWKCPEDGLYKDTDLKSYFEGSDHCAYIIRVGKELAGFALLHHVNSSNSNYWVMDEFFILAKFQRNGIGKEVAVYLWGIQPGLWKIPIIPENKNALNFWRKVISGFTNGHYKDEIQEVDYDKYQPKRRILSFDTSEQVIPRARILQLSDLVIEEINQDQSEELCRNITSDLPEYFGIPSANEQYFSGVRQCKNLAAKINDQYVGLLSLQFPYKNNSNIYWMAVLRKYQSNGVGCRLIEKAHSLMKEENVSSMTVETLAPDHADENYLKTYHFYQAMGFKPLFNLKPEGYEWNMVYMIKNLE